MMNQDLLFFTPFNSDIWTIEQQQNLYKAYQNLQTIGDWVNFCSTEDFKLLMETLSFDPAPYSQTQWPIKRENWSFHTVCKLQSIDLVALHNKVTHMFSKLAEQDTEYKETRTSQRDNWQKERKMVANLGLDRNPHLIAITTDNFPELQQFLHSLELEHYTAQWRNNYIGSNLPTHTDALDHLWVTMDELYPGENILNKPFDHLVKNTPGYYPVRLLMHIDDWEPGQVVGFKDKLWTWEAGDCVAFDWQNVKHYASNVSYKNRYQLRVTGFTRDPHHWIFDAVNNVTFKTL